MLPGRKTSTQQADVQGIHNSPHAPKHTHTHKNFSPQRSTLAQRKTSAHTSAFHLKEEKTAVLKTELQNNAAVISGYIGCKSLHLTENKCVLHQWHYSHTHTHM